MDLAIEPDVYEPIMDEKGNYIDYLPPSSKFQNGLRCACGSRKEHVFDTRQSFSGHSKTKTHQKWLTELNNNKLNYFSENIKLNEIIAAQKIVIAKLQREKDDNAQLVVHLTKKIEMQHNPDIMIDLINFD
jgi:alpha-N-acetylglucosamine transferase